MMTNAQQGFAHYQQPPTQTDIGKIFSEVLNRISGLDEKLVRLDDIEDCSNLPLRMPWSYDNKYTERHWLWRSRGQNTEMYASILSGYVFNFVCLLHNYS
jgi:hypothetical protein